jgi:hypothetical protein
MVTVTVTVTVTVVLVGIKGEISSRGGSGGVTFVLGDSLCFELVESVLYSIRNVDCELWSCVCAFY